MFIATAMENQFKLRTSEIKAVNTLRSYGAIKRKQPGVYKHFIPAGLISPRNLLKNKRFGFATRRPHRSPREELKILNHQSLPSLLWQSLQFVEGVRVLNGQDNQNE